MNTILTNYGWMVTRHLVKTGNLQMGQSSAQDLLLDLWTGITAPYQPSDAYNELFAEGLVKTVDEPRAQSELRYRRNPFEHIDRVIFEVTTLCNFDCAHCYNSYVPRLTESNPQLLMQAADIFLTMGVRRFDFVGGEVSLYGKGWLDLVKHIRTRGDDIIISLYSNGWWLEKQNFHAAGKRYADVSEYLADLKQHGVSHIMFSLDGQNEEHDSSRHHAGLYQRILRGLKQVRLAGLAPRVSLLLRPDWTPEQVESFLAEPASILYDFDESTPARKRALRLILDPTNSASNFIDIGNGAADERQQFLSLDDVSLPLYCRNFYRLSPSLTIKANGEIATCRLSQAGEGYGNLHERPLVDILNHFDEAFIYQLHANRNLETYLPYVNRALFGDTFTHLCSLRSIVTMLARKMREQNIGFDDLNGIAKINEEVAALTGHLKSG